MRSTTHPAAVCGHRRAFVATLCAAIGLAAFGLSRPAAAPAYPNKPALAQKDVQEAMAKIGVNILGSTPAATAQFFRTELDKHTVLAKRGGAKLD